MENVIQFIANYDEWKSVKKLTIGEKTDKRAVMEFIVSLSMGFDARVEKNLGDIVDLSKVDVALDEIQCGKSEEEIASALKAVNSRNVSGTIKEAVAKPELGKKERKELEQFCRVYALKKVLKNCGLGINYSDVDIPSLKRLKRAKV